MCNWSSVGRDCIWNSGLLASSSFVCLGFNNKALEYRSNWKAAACVSLRRTPFLERAHCRPTSKRVVEPLRVTELSLELPPLESS